MKRILTVMLITLLLLCGCALASMLNLPVNLKTVGDEAFCGDQSLGTIVLSENVEKIGSRAFANSSIKEITLTSAITSIADDAFEACGDFKVNVPVGCYAYNLKSEL